MRMLAKVAGLAGVLLLAVAPAHAAEAGSIDHVETDGGRVKMLFSVPVEAGTADIDSVKVTVAGQQVEAEASTHRAGEIERTVVLALDVSDSMRGDRFAAAKQAALAYLETAPEDVAIGLVTFAGSVTVVDSPTTDHESLKSAVAGLDLSRGTRLYDGLLESLTQAGSEGQRDVVVLSDGADTSGTPLAHVVTEAADSGVRVNVVALEQTPSATEQLAQITDATDGHVLPADDPQALAEVFTNEAQILAQQTLITFRAPRSGGTTVTASVVADGETYTDSTFTTLTLPRAGRAPAEPIPVTETGTGPHPYLLYGGLVAVGLGLAVGLAVLLLGRSHKEESLLERQLHFYSAGAQTARNGDSAKPRTPIDVRASAVAVADQVVQQAGFEERLNQRLTAAGIAFTAAEWLLLHAGIAMAAGLGGLILGGAASMILLLLVGIAGPWVVLKVKAGLRLKGFGSQLPDTLQLMSGGLSAGLSLPQAVDTVVREGTEPMAGELRRALIEQRLGVDIEDALDGIADRMSSKDFGWVVMAIRIQREVGGNLAELLGTVANTIREREYLRRQVKTLSAEGRLSAFILGGLPPMLAVYLSITRPEYLDPKYTTPHGWLMSISAVALITIGAFVMKGIVKVEV